MIIFFRRRDATLQNNLAKRRDARAQKQADVDKQTQLQITEQLREAERIAALQASEAENGEGDESAAAMLETDKNAPDAAYLAPVRAVRAVHEARNSGDETPFQSPSN